MLIPALTGVRAAYKGIDAMLRSPVVYRDKEQETAMPDKSERKERGRPAKPVPRIPDTFENVVKALVAPVKSKGRD